MGVFLFFHFLRLLKHAPRVVTFPQTPKNPNWKHEIILLIPGKECPEELEAPVLPGNTWLENDGTFTVVLVRAGGLAFVLVFSFCIIIVLDAHLGRNKILVNGSLDGLYCTA